MDSAEESAKQWEELAAEQDRRGAWDREQGISDGAVNGNKARLYRAVATSLRMEAETGIPHCSGCFRPVHGGRKCTTATKT